MSETTAERVSRGVQMTDITSTLLKYRNCVRQLWNDYFLNQVNNDPENGEVKIEYYQHIRETLFTSLVLIHEFGETIKPEQDVYYNELQVQPVIGPLGYRAMVAKIENDEYNYDYIWIKTDQNSFKFIDFFDWTDEDVMDCQFAEVVLVASEEFPDLIGLSFLFDAASVRYWKLA